MNGWLGKEEERANIGSSKCQDPESGKLLGFLRKSRGWGGWSPVSTFKPWMRLGQESGPDHKRIYRQQQHRFLNVFKENRFHLFHTYIQSQEHDGFPTLPPWIPSSLSLPFFLSFTFCHDVLSIYITSKSLIKEFNRQSAITPMKLIILSKTEIYSCFFSDTWRISRINGHHSESFHGVCQAPCRLLS